MLTHEKIHHHAPCWLRVPGGERRLREACDRLGGTFTIVDVLRADWIDPTDRVWVATRPGVLPDVTLRLFAVRTARRRLDARRAVGHEPDPRSLAAVETAERHARGAATDEELRAARMAASEAADAAREAADAAASEAADAAASEVAWAAAWAAAWEAAWEAGNTERQQQVSDLLDLLSTNDETPAAPEGTTGVPRNG